MDSMALREHLSIGQLLREATCRWLKGHEVLHILRNYKAEGYSHNRDVVRCPPSGSVFLFRPKVTKYRLDGVVWRRGRDGKRLLECHERLKVDGVEVLRCCYVQAEANRSFHRRVYSLLGASSADPTVLVHYLQEPTIDHHPQPAQPPPPRPLPTQPPAPSASQVVDWDQLDEELMALVASPPAGPPPLPGSPSPVMMMAAAESLYGQNQHQHHTLPQDCKPMAAAATIQDLSPEWDYVTGGAKVLITGHFPPTAPGTRLTCMFDDVVVPADFVQAGVLRCFVPSHVAGIVPLSITLGDRTPVSNIVHFEYREFQAMATTAPDKEGAPPACPAVVAVAPPTQTTPTYDDTFKADVLKRLAALESTMRHAPSTPTSTTTTTTTAPMETCEAQQARDGGGGSAEYQKLWEAFSLLVKLEGARGPGDSDLRRSRTMSGEAPSSEREREEQAALLIQSTFRDYRSKKRNEAAKKIQKLYRQRYAKRSGAATMIQAAFRGYTQKMRLLRMMKKAAPTALRRRRPESSQDANDDDDDDEQNDEEEEKRDDDGISEEKGKERADADDEPRTP